MRIPLAIGSILLAAGCGGSLASGPDSGADDAAVKADSGDSGMPIPDAGLTLSCPTTVPVDGAVCGNANLQCEYGAQPRPMCNTVATCTNHMWSVAQADLNACAGFGSKVCPADPKTIPFGQLCNSSYPAICSYALGYCSCDISLPDAGDGPRWTCDNPRAGCDSPRPQLGSKCQTAGLQCDYSVCTTHNGVRLQCDVVLPSGELVWQQHAFTCP